MYLIAFQPAQLLQQLCLVARVQGVRLKPLKLDLMTAGHFRRSTRIMHLERFTTTAAVSNIHGITVL